MRKKISEAIGFPPRMYDPEVGFSLLELMIVAAIILILSGVAVPYILNFIHASKLRGTGSDYAGVLQSGRIRAIQDDRFYSTYIVAGSPTQAYVDLTSNGGTGWVSGDPNIGITSEVTTIAVANAPDTTNLKTLFLPAGSGLVPKDGSTTATPVVFSPRGLPCSTQSATGGTVCTSSGGATAFWIFFQDNISNAWEAVTVSPAGRIQKWGHATNGWWAL